MTPVPIPSIGSLQRTVGALAASLDLPTVRLWHAESSSARRLARLEHARRRAHHSEAPVSSTRASVQLRLGAARDPHRYRGVPAILSAMRVYRSGPFQGNSQADSSQPTVGEGLGSPAPFRSSSLAG